MDLVALAHMCLQYSICDLLCVMLPWLHPGIMYATWKHWKW